MNPFGGDWIFKSRCWNEQPDPEMFNPQTKEALEEVKSFCAHCPVTVECIEYANRMGIREVAGGKTFMARMRQESSHRKYLKALEAQMRALLPALKDPNAA
jgi:hypothetical protein